MIRLNEDNLDKVEHCVRCVVPEKQTRFLLSLVKEASEINDMLTELPGQHMKHISIYWENEHTEYSPERTDPCPDYYGSFYIMMNDINQVIGDAMTIEQLDEALSLLYDFVEMQNIEKDDKNTSQLNMELMTLDEAMQHCKEVYESNEGTNYKCSLEHWQLYNWLRELKEYRETNKENK